MIGAQLLLRDLSHGQGVEHCLVFYFKQTYFRTLCRHVFGYKQPGKTLKINYSFLTAFVLQPISLPYH